MGLCSVRFGPNSDVSKERKKDKGESEIRLGLASAVLKIYCLFAWRPGRCNAFCLHVKYRQSTDHGRHCTERTNVDVYRALLCSLRRENDTNSGRK